MDLPAPGVSVIVCCYNSEKRLPQTLECLAMQQLPTDFRWEVIIIDNASADDTSGVAEREWAKHEDVGANFTLLKEPAPGKNYAFKKGLLASRYEYILTCDDDNWLCPTYVFDAFTIMNADCTIGALGGFGIFEPEQPVNKEIQGFLSYYVNGSQTWATTDHWVYGAGSVYRKSLLLSLFNGGWRQITTGRKGKSLICGEDVEICFMIYLCGYRIIADDRLKFNHYVPLTRQSTAYIIDLSFWLSYSHVLLNSYYPILNNDKREIGQIINGWLFSASKTYAKNLLLSNFRKISWGRKTTTSEKMSFNAIYGTWYALITNRKRIIRHHLHTRSILAAIKNISNQRQIA